MEIADKGNWRGKTALLRAILPALIILFSAQGVSLAVSDAVQEQEPKYASVSLPAEAAVIRKKPSSDKMLTNLTVGVVQGFDSNVNLDYSKKPDNYTEENLDVHYKYPLLDNITALGLTNSRFGFNITNVTYYNFTDVSMLDGLFDAKVEHEFHGLTATAGYAFEFMWYPNDRTGNFYANEFVGSLRQKLGRYAYQKVTYKFVLKSFMERKARLGTGIRGSDLRQDHRDLFEYVFNHYITNDTSVKLLAQCYLNNSNDQYYDYYDYRNYKVGGSIIQFFTKKLYAIAAFYYQRREYEERVVTDKDDTQDDNLLITSATLLYDVSKKISVFVNFSRRENHTNEPLEKYSDNIYSGGLYYSF